MWNKKYEVKASYHGRTIYFEVEAVGMAAALKTADDTARQVFKDAGHNVDKKQFVDNDHIHVSDTTDSWRAQSKIKIKEKKEKEQKYHPPVGKE